MVLGVIGCLSGSAIAQNLITTPASEGTLIAEGYDLRLAVMGLNYPSGIAEGENGTFYVSEAGFPGIPPTVKTFTMSDDGPVEATVLLTPAMLPLGAALPPFTDVNFHNGMLWLSHRQKGVNDWTVGALSRFDPADPAGTFVTVITNLPSAGDHSNNTLIFGADGRGYFGQGSATNSSVVGADNADWAAANPGFREIPPVDIELSGTEYRPLVPTPLDPDQSAVTAPYRPYNSGAVDMGFDVPGASPATPQDGIIAGTGTVYSFDPMADNPTMSLRLEAWGLRNPFGIGFDADDPTRLFVSNNGSDIRGQAGDPNDPLDPDTYVIRGNRPIAGDWDEMFELTVGGDVEFFGWPDFLHNPETNQVLDITDPLFCDNPALPDTMCPTPVFSDDFRESLTVQPAFSSLGIYISVTGFSASSSEEFGARGDLFVTESGSFSPQTGAFTFTGHKVSRVDQITGQATDFIVNQGQTPEELFQPMSFNKPVSAEFSGDRLMIVDLGVLEPGINLFQARTGKVWVVTNNGSVSTDNLEDQGVSIGDLTPNPTSAASTLTLDLAEARNFRISLHDLSGREVSRVFDGDLDAGQRSQTISTEGVANGAYVVRIISSGGVATRRLVVTR